MCIIIEFNELTPGNNLHLYETHKTTEVNNGLFSHFKADHQLKENIEDPAKPNDLFSLTDMKPKNFYKRYDEHLTSIPDAHILSLIYGSLS